MKCVLILNILVYMKYSIMKFHSMFDFCCRSITAPDFAATTVWSRSSNQFTQLK